MVDASTWSIIQSLLSVATFVLIAVMGWVVNAMKDIRHENRDVADKLADEGKRISVLEAQHTNAMGHLELVRDDMRHLKESMNALLQEIRKRNGT